MAMHEVRIRTTRTIEPINITAKVMEAVKGREGKLLHLYTPHTTCGLLINEAADPEVVKDILDALEKVAPKDYPYRHFEGNGHAHIKSSLLGCSLTLPFSQGKPILGTWQGIFLIEFDGPRERKVIITVI
jgi:secondary thiamine-phosphate synthase enzyme